MVWPYRSPIPVGRRGVISSFNWFLPAVATYRGGGSAPCGLDGETEEDCEDRKGRGYERRSLTSLKKHVPDEKPNGSVFHLLLNFRTNSTTLSRLTIQARDIRRGQGLGHRHSGTRHLQCKRLKWKRTIKLIQQTGLNSNFSEALSPILY